MRMELERIIDDFKKEIYIFWLDGYVLYLDEYRVLTRETKRHKYQIVIFYNRLAGYWDERKPNFIKVEDVPLTDDIKKAALDKFISKIRVDTWKER